MEDKRLLNGEPQHPYAVKLIEMFREEDEDKKTIESASTMSESDQNALWEIHELTKVRENSSGKSHIKHITLTAKYSFKQ